MFLRVFPLFSTFPGCKCAKSVGVSFSDLFAAAIPEAKARKKRKIQILGSILYSDMGKPWLSGERMGGLNFSKAAQFKVHSTPPGPPRDKKFFVFCPFFALLVYLRGAI